jgi:hypothetical protein
VLHVPAGSRVTVDLPAPPTGRAGGRDDVDGEWAEPVVVHLLPTLSPRGLAPASGGDATMSDRSPR